MIEKLFFVFATIVDLVAALWIVAALFTSRLQSMPRWHMAGLAVGAFGLMAQAVRNIEFLATGVSAPDSHLPLWFLKDLGYGMIAFDSIWRVMTGRLNLNASPPPIEINHPSPPKRTPKARPKAKPKPKI